VERLDLGGCLAEDLRTLLGGHLPCQSSFIIMSNQHLVKPVRVRQPQLLQICGSLFHDAGEPLIGILT
jgi:hypothetical protein